MREDKTKKALESFTISCCELRNCKTALLLPTPMAVSLIVRMPLSICVVVCVNTSILFSIEHRPSVISLYHNTTRNTFVFFDDNDHTAKTGSCGFGPNDRTVMLRMCGIGHCVMADTTHELERNRMSARASQSYELLSLRN